MEFRETTIRANGVERVIRTERTGKVRTVRQLESAHTRSVMAAVVEMRIRIAPDSMPYDMAERLAKEATRLPRINWEDPRKPLRPARTVDPTTYLVEVGPGHFATKECISLMGAISE